MPTICVAHWKLRKEVFRLRNLEGDWPKRFPTFNKWGRIWWGWEEKMRASCAHALEKDWFELIYWVGIDWLQCRMDHILVGNSAQRPQSASLYTYVPASEWIWNHLPSLLWPSLAYYPPALHLFTCRRSFSFFSVFDVNDFSEVNSIFNYLFKIL